MKIVNYVKILPIIRFIVFKSKLYHTNFKIEKISDWLQKGKLDLIFRNKWSVKQEITTKEVDWNNKNPWTTWVLRWRNLIKPDIITEKSYGRKLQEAFFTTSQYIVKTSLHRN